MPLLLRTIRKNRWYQGDPLPWLAQGDLPADPLGDLSTTFNALSVWRVEENHSNLQQIVAALAAMRESLSNFDYALFDEKILSQVQIKISETKGVTFDEQVNVYHRDLVELSASSLVTLAGAIHASNMRERVLSKDVGLIIRQAVSEGRIELTKLKEGIQKKIGVGPKNP